METQTTDPRGFSLEALDILSEAARFAEDDASGSVPEAHTDGSTGSTLVSAAHLLAALDAAAAGAVPGARATTTARVTTTARSTTLVNQILVDAAVAAIRARAAEITPDHLRAGLAVALKASGINADGLRRARARALGLAPSNLGVTALRHRDVSARAAR